MKIFDVKCLYCKNVQDDKLSLMVKEFSEDTIDNTIEFNEYLKMMSKWENGIVEEEYLVEAFR